MQLRFDMHQHKKSKLLLQSARLRTCLGKQTARTTNKRHTELTACHVLTIHGKKQVKAVEGGACALGGVSVTEPAILTHVNGLDVSPLSFRSLAPKRPGAVTWGEAVVPLTAFSVKSAHLTDHVTTCCSFTSREGLQALLYSSGVALFESLLLSSGCQQLLKYD
eukprot:10226-Heterococcus_DN1.PRE.4